MGSEDSEYLPEHMLISKAIFAEDEGLPDIINIEETADLLFELISTPQISRHELLFWFKETLLSETLHPDTPGLSRWMEDRWESDPNYHKYIKVQELVVARLKEHIGDDANLPQENATENLLLPSDNSHYPIMNTFKSVAEACAALNEAPEIEPMFAELSDASPYGSREPYENISSYIDMIEEYMSRYLFDSEGPHSPSMSNFLKYPFLERIYFSMALRYAWMGHLKYYPSAMENNLEEYRALLRQSQIRRCDIDSFFSEREEFLCYT